MAHIRPPLPLNADIHPVQNTLEYTAQNLEYAVSVFYNGEQTERAQAHAWLTAAQRVPSAWQFVWELLQPNKGTEIQFYAATTLHTKILRCWHELPPESYEELKLKLLDAIHAYANGPKIVTNRLCISLAAFILQQSCTNLVSILRPLSTEQNMSLLLEVLTVIPEEYNSMTMGSTLRARNRAALHQACPMVLDDMMHHLQSAYEDYSSSGPTEERVKAWLRAVTCACSWLTLGGEEAELTGDMPERMPLMRALMRIVTILYQQNECVSGTALECCEACLAGVRAAGAGADAARHPQAARQLIAELVQLARPVMARDNCVHSINEELVSSLITCLVCITECHSALVVTGALEEEGGPLRELVGLLLAAQEAPGHYPQDETRSSLVFGVWFTLQDEIVQESVPSPPLWVAVYERLLTALITKSEAHDRRLAKDDQELLRCYRQDVADTAMYCFFMVGDACWSTIESAFEQATTDARREAALHALLAVADAAPSNRAPPPLLGMLERAVLAANTATDVQTITTALDAIGSYAPWLSCEAVARTARGAMLGGAALAAAGGALSRRPAAARPAALALRRLCADCAQPAASCVADIVQVAMSGACRADSWARRQAVSAAGLALAVAPSATAEPLLDQLAQQLREDLEQQVSRPTLPSGAAECCGALLSALGGAPAYARRALAQLLPALPPLAAHPLLVEPLFLIVTQILSSQPPEELLGELARLAVAGLHTRPCAAGLDVVNLIVIVAGPEWQSAGPLLHGVVSSCAAELGRAPAAPDLAEGLFKLLHSVSRKRPAFLECLQDLLPQLVDLACNCIRLWEAGAARAACGWLCSLAEARPQAIAPAAPGLVRAALLCIGGASPRNQIDPLSELLVALNRGSFSGGAGGTGGAGLGQWLRQALAEPGFPTPHATDHHKQKFIAAVLRERSSKRRVMDAVQEFCLACRGLIGTEYARQAIASRQLIA